MSPVTILWLSMAVAGPIQFERHEIDTYPGGYQVAVADLTGNGRPDVIALSTSADRVDWYENPGWKRRPVARTAKNIDLAPRDVDGDGRPEIVAGWRGDGGGLRLDDPADATGDRYATVDLDRGITVEGAVAADLNLNGKLDLVAIASRSNNLVWYENLSQ